MATSAASSEHFEKLHEIFRGLLEDLRGVPERLLGTAGTGEARAGPDQENSTWCGPPRCGPPAPRFPFGHAPCCSPAPDVLGLLQPLGACEGIDISVSSPRDPFMS